MPGQNPIRCAVLSVVKHAYVPHGVAGHPRFELAVVADDADQPDWAHERNQKLADEYNIPYVTDVEKALSDYGAEVAVISSAAERHCDLSVRAANAGLHVIQDKPMSNRLSECDRVVEAVEAAGVKFLMWNRNYLPAVVHAQQLIAEGRIGRLRAAHCDFYFSKDCGPPKGSRQAGDPPINWLEHNIAAHRDGSDGGLGHEPLGELQVEGCYPLGYLEMLTAARVERVFARTASHFHQVHVDNQVEDLASVTLQMESGITGSLSIGRIGASSHPDIGEIKLRLIGDRGSLVINEARPEVAIYYRGQPPLEFRHQRLADENSFLLMQGFVEAIEHDVESVMNARVARDIAATVFAAVESGKTGQVVEVS